MTRIVERVCQNSEPVRQNLDNVSQNLEHVSKNLEHASQSLEHLWQKRNIKQLDRDIFNKSFNSINSSSSDFVLVFSMISILSNILQRLLGNRGKLETIEYFLNESGRSYYGNINLKLTNDSPTLFHRAKYREKINIVIIEKSFLIDPLTTNNTIYRDSLILKVDIYKTTRCTRIVFQGSRNTCLHLLIK